MTKKVQVRIKSEIYFNKENGFGIYSVHPHKELLNSSNKVYYSNAFQSSTPSPTIKGEVGSPLKVDREYLIEVNKDPATTQHGLSYDIKIVHAPSLKTLDEQLSYLKSVVSKSQYESLVNAYPNEMVVDLILSDKIDVNKTKGIKEKSLAKILEKVKKDIGFSHLVTYFKELNVSDARIKSIKKHFANNPANSLEMIKKDFYILCNIKNMGFIFVDNLATRAGIQTPESPSRIKQGINYILEKELQSGHTWTDYSSFREQVFDLLGVDENLILNELKTLDKQGKILLDRGQYAKREKFEWKEVHEENKENPTRISLFYPILREELVSTYLEDIDLHYTSEWDNSKVLETITKQEAYQGFEYTEEQKEVILSLLNNGVNILNAGAGTGKSAVISAIAKIIDSQQKDYIACTLSGSAAKVLENNGIRASTIHRRLAYNGHGFEFDKNNPLTEDVIIVDEYSMVDINIFYHLLSAIKPGAQLILVGDYDQLPPVGFGFLARDIALSNRYNLCTLTQLHRQALTSGINITANMVRSKKQITPNGIDSYRTQYGQNNDTMIITNDDSKVLKKYVIDFAQEYNKKYIKKPEDLYDIQFISPVRNNGENSVNKLNQELQNIFNPMKENEPFLISKDVTYRYGDKVIVSGNSYGLHPVNENGSFNKSIKRTVYNGSIGVVRGVSFKTKTLIIEFQDHKEYLAFSGEDLGNIDLAYCSTVHKLQGSAANIIVFIMDFGAYTLLSKQLVYVAQTRARKRLLVFCNNKALHKAINTDEMQNRRTILSELFRDGKYRALLKSAKEKLAYESYRDDS